MKIFKHEIMQVIIRIMGVVKKESSQIPGLISHKKKLFRLIGTVLVHGFSRQCHKVFTKIISIG